MSSATPILISIEGNIGSGKSTLLKELRARHPDWHFIDEPVEAWMGLRHSNGKSLLELFYEDKNRWAYTFQNTAILTRIINARNAIDDWRAAGCPGSPIFIAERCVHTDMHVFAKLILADGDIDKIEWEIYMKWFNAFSKQIPEPAGFIHVDTPVTVCAERIGCRAREGEGHIPTEYLDKLDTAHFNWLRADEFPTPVLRFDNVSKDQTTIQDVEKWITRRWLESMD
jgi:deoxyadenosine/deoxycytidine kinase